MIFNETNEKCQTPAGMDTGESGGGNGDGVLGGKKYVRWGLSMEKC